MICFQVRTVGQPKVSDGTKLSEYIELVDGIYLNEIMLEMWVVWHLHDPIWEKKSILAFGLDMDPLD